jgi:hypothetical protein
VFDKLSKLIRFLSVITAGATMVKMGLSFFTLDLPGKETTFTVPEISVSILSRVLDKVMDRYAEFSKEVSKAKHEAVIVW